MKVLLAAYACDPQRGSEPGVGWNLARVLSLRYDVWLVTRTNNLPNVEAGIANLPSSHRLRAVGHEVEWALGTKRRLPGSVHPYHYLWHTTLARSIQSLHDEVRFDVAHWLTLGSFRSTTSLVTLGIPVVIGPIGGAEEVDVRFWPNFGPAGIAFETTRWLSNRLSTIDPLVRRSYRRASAILAASPDTERFLRRHFDVGDRVRVVPSIGVDQDLTSRSAPPRLSARGSLRLIFVARLVHWKGLHLAVDAVETARRSGIDVQLTVLGKGSHAPSNFRRAVDAGTVQWVERVESLAEVGELYRRHDALIFPSLHESGGMVAIEAMAEGLPVICVANGGPAVSVTPECGFAVPAHRPPDTVKALAQGIAALAEDPELRMHMSAACQRRISSYTWEAKAQQIASVYDAVLG